MIRVLPTDKNFNISPDAGDRLCVCSRCEHRIKSNEFALRIFTTNNNGEVDKDSLEYRYCEACQLKMGISKHRYIYDDLDDDDFIPCDKCDGHDACADFGCAIELGLEKMVKKYPNDIF